MTYNTVLNFKKGRYFGEGSEDHMVDLFIESYKSKFDITGQPTLFVKGYAVEGHGVADLVVVENKVVSKAFEFKLKNWRKGIMQAYRYHYYAKATYLVVPAGRIKKIKPRLHLFRVLNIGLWGFDPASGIIEVWNPKVHDFEFANEPKY